MISVTLEVILTKGVHYDDDDVFQSCSPYKQRTPRPIPESCQQEENDADPDRN